MKRTFAAVFICTAPPEPTGLWKKALGMAKPEDLVKIVRTVADDMGEAKPAAGLISKAPGR